MALERVYFPNVIWSKLQTQLKKTDNEELRAVFTKDMKVTDGVGGSLVWEPTDKFLLKVHQVLTKEETWTRNKSKGGTNHQLMISTIADLGKRIANRNLEPLPPLPSGS